MQSLQGLADSLSSYTDYSKPAVEQSEKVLLTFTDIGKNVFPDATKATADLAARMGIDLNSAALIVGKALGDPVKGVGALRREGVQLSAQQAEMVKHFMKVGDVADAQKVILGELEREMGGAAQAAGGTLGGQLTILKNKFDDVRAQIGDKLGPVLQKLLDQYMPAITAGMQKVGDVLEAGATFIVNNVVPALGQLSGIFGLLSDHTETVGGYLERVGGKFKEVGGIVVTHKGILSQLGDIITGTVVPALSQIGNFAETVVLPALDKLGSFAQTTLFPALKQLASVFLHDILPAAQAFIGFILTNVLPIVESLVGIFLNDAVPAIKQLATFFETVILPALKNLADFVQKTVVPIVKTLVDVFTKQVMPAAEQVASTITNQLLPPLEHILSKILPVLNPLLQVLGWILGNVIGPVIRLVISVIAGLLTALGWIIDRIGDLLGWLGQGKDKLGHLGDAFSALGTLAQNIWSGIQQAVKGGINSIIGDINGFIELLDKIQIHIPAVGVGPVKTPAFDWGGLGIPDIPYLAEGGDILKSGLAMVGERGPEPVWLPGGAQVRPNAATSQAIGGGAGGQPLIVNLDGRKIAEIIVPYMTPMLRNATGRRDF